MLRQTGKLGEDKMTFLKINTWVLLLCMIMCPSLSLTISAQQPDTETVSFDFGENRIKLQVDSEKCVFYLPNFDNPESFIQDLVNSSGLQIRIESMRELPYKGLWLVQFFSDQSLRVLNNLPLFQGGWAAPCLEYNGRLHIPRPELMVTLNDYDIEVYENFKVSFGDRIIREFPSVKPLFVVGYANPFKVEGRRRFGASGTNRVNIWVSIVCDKFLTTQTYLNSYVSHIVQRNRAEVIGLFGKYGIIN